MATLTLDERNLAEALLVTTRDLGHSRLLSDDDMALVAKYLKEEDSEKGRQLGKEPLAARREP